MASSGPGRHPVITATFWMMGALASFMAMAIGGRELAAARMGTFEILLFRSLVGLVMVSMLLARSGWGQISVRRFGLHLARNVSHFGGQFGWFYGIAMIPLAEVFAIEFTTPMWTAIIAALLLGERMTRSRLLAIGLGMAGMLIILRPGLEVIHPAALAVLGAAVCYALTFVLTRKLAHTESALGILFYMTVIQLPLALIPAMAHWVTPPPALWPWLLVVGATGLSAHYCHTRALRLADATAVAPMDFLRLPLIAVAGLLFYGEALDWLVFTGAAVMVAGNFANILSERARSRQV
jgi:drug/metabolite transporter (DMT)-like permease